MKNYMVNDKINILLIALYYYDEQEESLLKICKNGVSAAHHTLLNNLIKGLSAFSNVTVLSSLPIGSFPKMSNQLMIRSKRREHGFEIGYINIPILKDFIRQQTVRKEISKWANENGNNGENYVLVYDAIPSFVKGVRKARVLNVKSVLMIPDLPGEYSIENNVYNALIQFRLKQKAKSFYQNVKAFDAFIPLTKHMMNVINVEDKPYLVVECISENQSPTINSKKRSNQVMYAGELSEKVNINVLIEAIKTIDNCELIICGRGPAEDYVKDEAKKNTKIKYLGFVPKNRLKEIEKDVAVFVNPRQDNSSYTLYSFPSKNGEYLSTGKPLVAYMLGGIPEEYRDYMFVPKDNSVEELANTITRALSLGADELIASGSHQVEFMRSKNSLSQGARIVKFLKEI